MNRKLEYLEKEQRDKIIKVALKLEDAVILEKISEKMIMVVSKSNLVKYEKAIELKMFKNHEKNIPEDREFFCDWYTEIMDYSNISCLLNECTLEFFGNIKQAYNEENKTFSVHINSKKYWGNASNHKDLKEALIEAFYEALYINK